MDDTKLNKSTIRSEAALARALKDINRLLNFAMSKIPESERTEDTQSTIISEVFRANPDLFTEITWYISARDRQLEPQAEINEIGKLLVALRISSGKTQQQVAKALKVSPAQISRDEGKNYQGITPDRAKRVAEAIGYRLIVSYEKLEPERTGLEALLRPRTGTTDLAD